MRNQSVTGIHSCVHFDLEDHSRTDDFLGRCGAIDMISSMRLTNTIIISGHHCARQRIQHPRHLFCSAIELLISIIPPPHLTTCTLVAWLPLHQNHKKTRKRKKKPNQLCVRPCFRLLCSRASSRSSPAAALRRSSLCLASPRLAGLASIRRKHQTRGERRRFGGLTVQLGSRRRLRFSGFSTRMKGAIRPLCNTKEDRIYAQ